MPGHSEDRAPFFSVVVPVLNGGPAFRRCLDALRASRFQDFELLVADDGCSDGSAEAAREAGAVVLATKGREGPGGARNLAAGVARGDYLFFTDADCEVGAETLGRAAEALRADPALEALFGSYDDSPSQETLVAQYKNLQHHFVHQHASAEGSTFWTGCGAIRRETFLRLGGFDQRRYPRPSIEDIELGYRLRAAGGRIRVAHDVQVKHHKRWTLAGLVKCDLFDRGIPWTELMLEGGSLLNDLNLNANGRLSVATTFALVLLLLLSAADARFLFGAAAAALVLLVANRQLYGFFAKKRGIVFAAAAVPLHWLYHIVCGVAFVWGAWRHHRTHPA